MSRPKLPAREIKLPRLRLDLFRIMQAADRKSDVLAVDSDIGGVGFVYDSQGRVMLVQNDGFVMNSVDDWRPIIEELKWVVEEADKWARS